MPFKKGQQRRSGEHPLSNLTPQQRWESAIQMFAVMYRDWRRSDKCSKPTRPAKPEPRRRPPKPIRLHVVYEDFDGKVWHEHDSVYPAPNSADAPAGKPPADEPR